MPKETIGAYSFVTPDWKEKDYPLDLWLKWTPRIFDEVVLSLYGNVRLPSFAKRIPNLKIIKMEQPLITSFRFSTYGKRAAQKELHTDWKMILDIDEFLPARIDTNKLNKKYAYPCLYHHLYGNANTEIHAFFKYKYVLHHSNRAVINDGSSVASPYFLGFGRRVLNRIIGTDPNPPRNITPPVVFDIWHTGATRNPVALSKKWRIQGERLARNGVNAYKFLDALQEMGNSFDYSSYKRTWPNSYLTHVDDNELPEILRENKKRFLWVKSWPRDLKPVREKQ